MAFWITGDEEHEDPRFLSAGLSATGLYIRAGSWCMARVRGKHHVPDEWEIPDHMVRGWNATKSAGALVREGLWYRVPGGYRYAWIRDENKPARLRQLRQRERAKWEQKQRKRLPALGNSPGELVTTPQGSYRGELTCPET